LKAAVILRPEHQPISESLQNQNNTTMGDKSPKPKNKDSQQKQKNTTAPDQKKQKAINDKQKNHAAPPRRKNSATANPATSEQALQSTPG
jgi:hypothetical protein